VHERKAASLTRGRRLSGLKTLEPTNEKGKRGGSKPIRFLGFERADSEARRNHAGGG